MTPPSCSSEINNGVNGKNILKKHKVNTLTAFFIIFSMVCAGGYGIEDSISAAGPGMTLLLLMILPFFWSIPMGLISAEMGSAITEEGGFYKWIQRALGDFWGFQAGWWWTLSMYVDSTLYIILTADYLQAVITMTPLQVFLLKAGIILIFAYVNFRGLPEVGKLSTILSLVVIASFLLLTVLGLSKWQFNPFIPLVPEGQTVMQSIGLGLAICMWTYSGYEAISTMAGEVENPQVIPRAIWMSIPIIMFLFIMPTMASIAAVGNWQAWSTDGGISFVTVATVMGFPVFGLLFALAALSSNLSLYNAFLAASSRSFYAMSMDNLAPRFFSRTHKKYGTPHYSIISMAVVNLILCQYGFDKLVVIDVFLVMFAEMLIFISAVVLRIKEPDLPRPYKVPFGTVGLGIFCSFPIGICILALFTNGWEYFVGGILGAISGPIAYYIFKKQYGGREKDFS